MPIEFRCPTIVAYDQARDTYVRCNQTLSAPESQIAKFVVCHACQQSVLVPPVTETITAGPSSPSPGTFERNQASAVSSPPRPAMPPATEERLTFTGFDARSRCTRCSGPLDAQFRCVVCGYQSILPSDARQITRDEMQLAGCQLWLTKKLAHGIAVSNLLIAAHGLVGIIVIILGIVATVLGGGSAVMMLAVLAALVGAYAYAVIEFRRIARRPPAQLNAWQNAGWLLVLLFYRSGGWRPSRWRTLDLKNKQLNDEQIFAIPDLTTYHVLDLEGTGLTDAGMRRLRGLVGLQRLVVRRTQVTADAVCWLQQRLPHVWIWS
jgi:hypothetical protein